MRLFLALAIAVIFCIIATNATVPTFPLGQNAVPRFEPSDCAIQIPKEEKATCGYLVLYENRERKTRTIRLPIIILKSESPTPKPDPVLRTLGGPGASSLRLVRGRRSSPWLKDRDYVIFEQRGTKYSQPALECPEVDNANIESAKLHLDRKQSRRREIRAAKACYDRLTAQGIDLSSYNSAESAADIEDLRRALGIEKINLYGVSYSARLMLTAMRYYPAGIRSVVLESPLPPEVNYDEHGVDGIVRTLDLLFSSCRIDSECVKAIPDLETKFYNVVARLNKEPITAGIKDPKLPNTYEIKLNGDDFATWIVDYFFSNEPAATVEAPYVIEQAYRGNFEAFKRYAADKVNPSSYSWGMRYSVWCGEEIPFESRKKIDGQSTKFPGLKGYEVMSLPDICFVWKVRPAKPIENQPVKSDVPALILAAEYDAYTPPVWGRAVSKNLRNSFYFEVPWAGHGPAFSVPCVRSMVTEFIENPTTYPSDACVRQTKSQYKFLLKKP